MISFQGIFYETSNELLQQSNCNQRKRLQTHLGTNERYFLNDSIFSKLNGLQISFEMHTHYSKNIYLSRNIESPYKETE